MLLVGVQILAVAEFDQLLEILHTDDLAGFCVTGQIDGIGEVVDFRQIAVDFERIGDHQLDLHAQHTLQVRYPFGLERFGSGDGRYVALHLDRHDLQAFGIGFGDDLGDRSEIQLERVDVVVIESGTFSQPDGQ